MWNGLGASGAAIKGVFPRRLLDYILYEFITRSHAKIAGVFLLLAILRREPTPSSGNPAFIDGALVRIMDPARLLHALTHPRETFLTVLAWGTNEFNARPIVDGLALLASLIPGGAVTRGPEDEDDFVAVEVSVKPSARRNNTLVEPTSRAQIEQGLTGRFALWTATRAGTTEPESALFLAPALPRSQQGAPIDEVLALHYTLMGSVPENWIPFVPVTLTGQPTATAFLQGAMPRVPPVPSTGTPILAHTVVLPRGGILARDPVAQPNLVHAEEVLRSGLVLRRTFRQTRWYDGATFT